MYPFYTGEELLIYLAKVLKKWPYIHLYTQHFFDDPRKRIRMFKDGAPFRTAHTSAHYRMIRRET